jgi:hypothetical protein
MCLIEIRLLAQEEQKIMITVERPLDILDTPDNRVAGRVGFPKHVLRWSGALPIVRGELVYGSMFSGLHGGPHAAVRCPYCGEEHLHGWAAGGAMPDCFGGPNYIIELDPEDARREPPDGGRHRPNVV